MCLHSTQCTLTKWLLKHWPSPPLCLVNSQVMMYRRSDSTLPCQWLRVLVRPACLPADQCHSTHCGIAISTNVGGSAALQHVISVCSAPKAKQDFAKLH